LELVLIELEVLAKHNIERTLRPVRNSSSRERTPTDTSKAQKKARPLTFHADSLARSLDFHKKTDNVLNDKTAADTTLISKRKSAPLLSQASIKAQPSPPIPLLTATGGKSESNHSSVSQILPSPQPKSSPNEKTAKPALQREISSSERPKSKGQQNGTSTAAQPNQERHGPKSLSPYIPQHAAEQLVRNATPNNMKRENVHVLSLPVLDLFSGTKRTNSVEASPLPSPLPFLLPLSPLGASFSDSIQTQPRVATEKTSIDSDCSIPKHSDSVSSAGYPSTTPSSVPPSSPPATSTSTRRLDKRKSWNPRSIVAARKAKQESNERRMDRNNFQDTAAMAKVGKQVVGPHDVVALAGANARLKLERRKTTAFESFTASQSTPNLLSTGVLADDVPIPMLVLPGEQRRSDWAQTDEDDSEQKAGLWKRLRRRTLNGNQQPEPEEMKPDPISKMPSTEQLRWKQLAMRERAISDAKRPKENKLAVTLPQANPKKTDPLEVNLQQSQDLQLQDRKVQQKLVEHVQGQLIQGKNTQEKSIEQKEPEKQAQQSVTKKLVESNYAQQASLLIGTKPPTAPPKGAIPDIPRTPARSRKPSATSQSIGTVSSTKETIDSPLPISSIISSVAPSPPPKDEKIARPFEKAPRPISPFTSPRPPPRITSLQRKASSTPQPQTERPNNPSSPPQTQTQPPSIPSSPPKTETQPQSNVVTPRMSMGRAPSRDIYSTPIRPRVQSIRSRPLISPDGQPFLPSTSAMSITRPKTSGAIPIIPQGIPEFTYLQTQPTLYSQTRPNLQRGTTAPTGPETPSKASTKHKRISRFYSSPTVPTVSKPVNLEHVEKIEGMTPQSVLFLREQERLATEKFGRNFSLPIHGATQLRRSNTEVGPGSSFMSEGGNSKRLKRNNWWKVWRSK
jgi:hypothetical protein